MADGLVTLQELCSLLKVSESWVRRRVRNKEIPFLRFGKVLRFEYKKVLEAMNNEHAGQDGN